MTRSSFGLFIGKQLFRLQRILSLNQFLTGIKIYPKLSTLSVAGIYINYAKIIFGWCQILTGAGLSIYHIISMNRKNDIKEKKLSS